RCQLRCWGSGDCWWSEYRCLHRPETRRRRQGKTAPGARKRPTETPAAQGNILSFEFWVLSCSWCFRFSVQLTLLELRRRVTAAAAIALPHAAPGGGVDLLLLLRRIPLSQRAVLGPRSVSIPRGGRVEQVVHHRFEFVRVGV